MVSVTDNVLIRKPEETLVNLYNVVDWLDCDELFIFLQNEAVRLVEKLMIVVLFPAKGLLKTWLFSWPQGQT